MCMEGAFTAHLTHISIGQEPINTTINLHRISSDELLTNSDGLCIFQGRVYVADVVVVVSVVVVVEIVVAVVVSSSFVV